MTTAGEKRIVVLISGRGSNMEAIADACLAEAWPARIVAVISNRADAGGLALARARGIETRVVPHADFPIRDEFDAALADAIDAYTPDAIALAGFMRILGHAFVARYAGRLVNIHPSLLPAFAGLHTHERALEAGCKLAGASVHFVTSALDHGPIILQAAVPVEADDTPERLAARVLHMEHVVYPRAVRWLIGGELVVESGRVRHAQGEPQLAFKSDWPRC